MMNLVNVLYKLNFFYSIRIERGLFLNWFNPLLTFYFNFRLCSFKDAIRFPIFVYGWPRIFGLLGHAIFINGMKAGQVRLNRMWHVAGGPNNSGSPSEFNIAGLLKFKGSCNIGTDCKISVGRGAVLSFGDNCQIMSDCNISVAKEIAIGDNFLMAHSSQIFDNSYHYVACLTKGTVKRLGEYVYIGNNCWLCNNVTVMQGVFLPNDVVIASHSLVNKTIGNVQEKSLIGGIPAKILSQNIQRIIDPTIENVLNDYFDKHPESNTYSLNEVELINLVYKKNL